MKKRFYSKEFKREAVRLSHQRENIKALADELGIAVGRLYKWRRAARDAVSAGGPGTSQVDSAEIKRLRKELRERELELEILKKAVHIFSRSDGKSTSS